MGPSRKILKIDTCRLSISNTKNLNMNFNLFLEMVKIPDCFLIIQENPKSSQHFPEIFNFFPKFPQGLLLKYFLDFSMIILIVLREKL